MCNTTLNGAKRERLFVPRSRDEDDVARLEITVDDTGFVGRVERLGQIARQRQPFVRRDRSVFVELLGERLAA